MTKEELIGNIDGLTDTERKWALCCPLPHLQSWVKRLHEGTLTIDEVKERISNEADFLFKNVLRSDIQ